EYVADFDRPLRIDMRGHPYTLSIVRAIVIELDDELPAFAAGRILKAEAKVDGDVRTLSGGLNGGGQQVGFARAGWLILNDERLCGTARRVECANLSAKARRCWKGQDRLGQATERIGLIDRCLPGVGGRADDELPDFPGAELCEPYVSIHPNRQPGWQH